MTIDRYLSERPALRRPVIAALNAVEATAAGAASVATATATAGATHVAFLSLTDAARDEALRSVEAAHPELFKTLLNQTYTAYYTNPAVLLILGWNPPQPRDSLPHRRLTRHSSPM